MRFEDERYIRVYTRNTDTLVALQFEGRTLLWELLRHADRAGTIPMSSSSTPAQTASRLTGCTVEHAEQWLPLLFDQEVLVHVSSEKVLWFPRYVPAQESVQSNKLRQQAKRERRIAQLRQETLVNQHGNLVYFLQSPSAQTIKIGYTSDLSKRQSEVEKERGESVSRLGTIPGSQETEHELHERFNHLRIGRTAWFKPGEDLLEYIREVTGRQCDTNRVTGPGNAADGSGKLVSWPEPEQKDSLTQKVSGDGPAATRAVSLRPESCRYDTPCLAVPSRAVPSRADQPPEQSPCQDLAIRIEHPDGNFNSRDDIPLAFYEPSPWLLDDATAKGLTGAEIRGTLDRYRRVSRQSIGRQGSHDKAFAGFLERARKDKLNGGPNGGHGRQASSAGRSAVSRRNSGDEPEASRRASAPLPGSGNRPNSISEIDARAEEQSNELLAEIVGTATRRTDSRRVP